MTQMTFLSALLVFVSLGASASSKDLSSAKNTFQNLAKIVEHEACPKDFSQSVAETVDRLCTQAKSGEEVESETYLSEESETSPEISCKYHDEHFEVIFSGTPQERDTVLTVLVDDEGQVLKITKDQLEVSGKACSDLANRIDKGGRIPASADTELCFDYYPSTKLAASRDKVSCSANSHGK